LASGKSLEYDVALKICRGYFFRRGRADNVLIAQRLSAVRAHSVLQTMAKEQTDRTTLDLFADERRPGRPKTSPLTRDEQLRINKRNQLKRDKVRGLRRVELKMSSEAVDALSTLADQQNISRSELIEQMLLAQLKLS
jgi:hypothetical protein